MRSAPNHDTVCLSPSAAETTFHGHPQPGSPDQSRGGLHLLHGWLRGTAGDVRRAEQGLAGTVAGGSRNIGVYEKNDNKTRRVSI